jgi:DNA-binding PadR family transcriptional regulator
MARTFRRSPLALAVLTLLHEAPMHPYRMQRLIQERGKDQVINVGKRQSLYQTIRQLQRAALIEVAETSRQKGFPERTVYRLTREGSVQAVTWMREMLSDPGNEFPEFPAAVSFLPVLTPEDARAQLERRAIRLAERIALLDHGLQTYGADLPRLFLLEDEYSRTILEAELKWVRTIIADLRRGELTWNRKWIRGFLPPEAGSRSRKPQPHGGRKTPARKKGTQEK